MTATISTRQKVGLVLAGIFATINIPSVLFPTPDGEEGPPFGILVVSTLLGVVGLVAVVLAWRTGNRVALRVAAGAVILITLSALPAFFADVPAGLKLFVGGSTILSILVVVLLLSQAGRPNAAPTGSGVR